MRTIGPQTFPNTLEGLRTYSSKLNKGEDITGRIRTYPWGHKLPECQMTLRVVVSVGDAKERACCSELRFKLTAFFTFVEFRNTCPQTFTNTYRHSNSGCCSAFQKLVFPRVHAGSTVLNSTKVKNIVGLNLSSDRRSCSFACVHIYDNSGCRSMFR